MKYHIHLQIDQTTEEAFHHLSDVAIATLTHEGASSGTLSLVITSEERMRELNRRFANVDEPTDVLSFPDGTIDPDSGKLYFGDVVIALPIAEVQAERASHSLHTELALLTVHGVLHLLGYNHDDQNRRKRMWALQEKILKQLRYETSEWENRD